MRVSGHGNVACRVWRESMDHICWKISKVIHLSPEGFDASFNKINHIKRSRQMQYDLIGVVTRLQLVYDKCIAMIILDNPKQPLNFNSIITLSLTHETAITRQVVSYALLLLHFHILLYHPPPLPDSLSKASPSDFAWTDHSS